MTDKCKNCGESNWGNWTSSSSGKVNRYCRTCRRKRTKDYSKRRDIVSSSRGPKLESDKCKNCGESDWGKWTSSSSGKVNRYCRACRRKRAANYSKRKSNSKGSHTPSEWLSKLAKYEHCPRCKRKWTLIPPRPDRRYKNVWTKDHIIPLISGGSDNIENIQPLCYGCNSSKGAKQ